MNDQEFKKLQEAIEGAAYNLERLQRQHIKETGRRYVPNRLTWFTGKVVTHPITGSKHTIDVPIE